MGVEWIHLAQDWVQWWLWTQQWRSVFSIRREILWLAKPLWTHRDGLSSMELADMKWKISIFTLQITDIWTQEVYYYTWIFSDLARIWDRCKSNVSCSSSVSKSLKGSNTQQPILSSNWKQSSHCFLLFDGDRGGIRERQRCSTHLLLSSDIKPLHPTEQNKKARMERFTVISTFTLATMVHSPGFDVHLLWM